MLEYAALALLITMVTFMIYLLIYIHDIPYEIAKKRGHPHKDAIHIAGWVSMFLLHSIWPLELTGAGSDEQGKRISQLEEQTRVHTEMLNDLKAIGAQDQLGENQHG